jgi:hypothetical protein
MENKKRKPKHGGLDITNVRKRRRVKAPFRITVNSPMFFQGNDYKTLHQYGFLFDAKGNALESLEWKWMAK